MDCQAEYTRNDHSSPRFRIRAGRTGPHTHRRNSTHTERGEVGEEGEEGEDCSQCSGYFYPKEGVAYKNCRQCRAISLQWTFGRIVSAAGRRKRDEFIS